MQVSPCRSITGSARVSRENSTNMAPNKIPRQHLVGGQSLPPTYCIHSKGSCFTYHRARAHGHGLRQCLPFSTAKAKQQQYMPKGLHDRLKAESPLNQSTEQEAGEEGGTAPFRAMPPPVMPLLLLTLQWLRPSTLAGDPCLLRYGGQVCNLLLELLPKRLHPCPRRMQLPR